MNYDWINVNLMILQQKLHEYMQIMISDFN